MGGYYSTFFNVLADCRCGLGAVNSTCSNIGACYCQVGVTGLKCDQCLPFYHNLAPASGCQRCTECELSLHQQIVSSLKILSHVNSTLSAFQLQLLTDMAADSLINTQLDTLTSRPDPLSNSLTATEGNLQDLNLTTLDQTRQFALRSNNKVCLKPMAHRGMFLKITWYFSSLISICRYN